MTRPAPSYLLRPVDGVHVFEFQRGDMTDAAFIKQLGDDMYRALKDLTQPRVVVDFQNVRKLSSATLGMLVQLKKVLARQDGELRVSNVSKELSEIFRITRLNDVLRLCRTTQEALDSFAG